MSCESVTRLDLDLEVPLPAEVDQAVVVAVAPCRVAGAVIGRADVIADYLQLRGLEVRAVHVCALQEGALWTSLRGDAMDGTMPPLTRTPSTSHHHWRLPRISVVGADPSRTRQSV